MGTITVTADPRRRLVRVRMGGLLTVAQVDAFSREEQAAVAGMGCGSGEFDLLVEVRGSTVQTQEVTDALGALMLHSPLKAGRIAIVRDGDLTLLQSRRLARIRDSTGVFDHVADAEEWLAA